MYNEYQKLQYMITLYWKFIGIEDLYSKMKKHWKIESAKDLGTKKVNSLYMTYKYWLDGLENGEIKKDIEKERILEMLSK